MKIILLSILFLLLFSRIKSTPSSLSKKVWTKRQLKNRKQSKSSAKIDKNLVSSITILVELLFVIFYTTVGCIVGTDGFYLLSALQIVTCVWSGINIKKDGLDGNKFYRWFFLFNTLLDYIYYPFAIYMLLK